MMQKVFITTAIDYTNDVIHLGHSYQKVLADCISRYFRQKGEDVFYMTGTDEHGGKVEESAKNAGLSPKEFVDKIVEKNISEWISLNLNYQRFMRTTDPDHRKVVTEFWLQCAKNGDIYLGKFEGKYCLGCEEYKEEKDLENDLCPLHKTKSIQIISEENYFFKWSKYQNALSELYRLHPEFVKPEKARNEMLAFLESGISDIAISRSKAKLSWGIPVPGDDTQTIYVWFDALINYYTAGKSAGYWGENTEIIHILGKDNLRWHALLWPAMLMSAGYDLPTTIYSHGFINLSGQKISKSLGNVIRPSELVGKWGSDAVRYYLLRFGPQINDSDLSLEKLKSVFDSELANDWGNLVSRVIKLASNQQLVNKALKVNFDKDYSQMVENFKISEAISLVMSWVREVNEEINEVEPWKMESGDELNNYLTKWLQDIQKIAFHLSPAMPTTSNKVLEGISGGIQPIPPLFPKIQTDLKTNVL